MKKHPLTVLVCILISVSSFLMSCASGPVKTTPTVSPPASPTSTPVAQSNNQPAVAALTDKVKFKRDDGSEVFSLKAKEDGAKLVDVNDQELARITVDSNQKIKIKNAADQVLGYVVTKSGYWKIENANQTQELYILRQQEDGDYQLDDGADQQIYRIKVRDYGWEIETPEKKSLYKVKVKDGKISLRDASDKTVLSTKDKFYPLAVACFGLDKLTREQQAALAYAVNMSGGR